MKTTNSDGEETIFCLFRENLPKDYNPKAGGYVCLTYKKEKILLEHINLFDNLLYEIEGSSLRKA